MIFCILKSKNLLHSLHFIMVLPMKKVVQPFNRSSITIVDARKSCHHLSPVIHRHRPPFQHPHQLFLLSLKFINKLLDCWMADLDNLCNAVVGWTGWKLLLPEFEKRINHFSLFPHGVRVPPVVKTSIMVLFNHSCNLCFQHCNTEKQCDF